MSDSETVELPSDVEQPAPTRRARRSGFWRELSGSIALGLCALAVLVLGVQVVAWINGNPGPGLSRVISHFGFAGLAVGAQLLADRARRRLWIIVAVVGVLVIAATALWLFWWA